MADLKMPEINYVIVAGNLTKDPVCRQTTNNTPVVNFSIASNRKYKDKLKKGFAVLVDGELQSRNWKSEDGLNRSIVEIKARRIQFLNRKNKADEVEKTETTLEEPVINELEKDYSDDSFDKFLSNEESELLK